MGVESPFRFDDNDSFLQISYLCVLRAVGRSAGTQPDQKMRIRQLVSSTILIFLVCFSPYHVFLLVRTLLERDCNFIAGRLPSKIHWPVIKTVYFLTMCLCILVSQEYLTTTTCHCCWPAWTVWPTPLSTVSSVKALATASSDPYLNLWPGYYAAAVAAATPAQANQPLIPMKLPPRRTMAIQWCCSHTPTQSAIHKQTIQGKTQLLPHRLMKKTSYP